MARIKVETLTKRGRIHVEYINDYDTEEYKQYHNRQWQLLTDNFELLLANKDKIYANPELFYCKTEAITGSSFTGGMRIDLGVLFKLYDEGRFKISCNDCDDEIYLLTMAGGLSMNHYTGYCLNEKSLKSGSVKNYFSKVVIPAIEIIRRYPNVDIKLPAVHPKFSWSKGNVGEYIPEKIIKKAITGESLDNIIASLINSDTKSF